MIGLILAMCIMVAGWSLSLRLGIGLFDNVSSGLVQFLGLMLILVYASFGLFWVGFQSMFNVQFGLLALAGHVLAWIITRKFLPV